MKEILNICDLSVNVDNKQILNKINLKINKNEIHAILGPNGNGKSTLLQTIMGNSNYDITNGEIFYLTKNIESVDINDRAKKGIFLSFQNPIEIDGVVNLDFLRTFVNINKKSKQNLVAFYHEIENASKEIKLPINYLERYLNFGFSGGEKKSNELLQLKLKKPSLALIDEIDSGLDVDSLKTVSNVINELYKNNNLTALIVSHYEQLYNQIPITKFHVMINGSIVCSGDKKMFNKIREEGFDWIYKKYNLEKSQIKQSILDSCAIPGLTNE